MEKRRLGSDPTPAESEPPGAVSGDLGELSLGEQPCSHQGALAIKPLVLGTLTSCVGLPPTEPGVQWPFPR